MLGIQVSDCVYVYVCLNVFLGWMGGVSWVFSVENCWQYVCAVQGSQNNWEVVLSMR